MYDRRGSTSMRVRQERPQTAGTYTGIRRTRERRAESINALRRGAGRNKDGRKGIIRERRGGKVAARVRFPEPLVARKARRRGREGSNRRYRQSKQKVERFNLSSVEVGCKKTRVPCRAQAQRKVLRKCPPRHAQPESGTHAHTSFRGCRLRVCVLGEEAKTRRRKLDSSHICISQSQHAEWWLPCFSSWTK
ncbi:hypothetical protein TGPRC2_297700 [Toxoplasma gondii TgCatPRC2]|uniref:Uncharacterized protein n=1 Tax=Toxoplasma gondii TgCatPRC2 TaxID=1130821 RepID=A0A151H1Y2_TOXGO|nr:hypothetical protein TGPRC2_297700 [Toxoplasma gondii TgCatPRC2]